MCVLVYNYAEVLDGSLCAHIHPKELSCCCEIVNVTKYMCEPQFSCIKNECICRSSSCLCYPFSATLPWRQCPPGVMGDECARAIYSPFLPPSVPPSLLPSITLSFPLFLFSSISFTYSISALFLLPLSHLSSLPFPSFLCSFFPLTDWLNSLLLKMRYHLMRQRVRKGRGQRASVF